MSNETTQTIDTPEFQALETAYTRALGTGDIAGAIEARKAFLAYIDGRTASPTHELREAARALIAAFDDPSCSLASVNNYVRDIERALGRTASTAADAEPEAKAAPVSREWQAVTRAGQVKKGDKLRFMIGDKLHYERAKLILEQGTNFEEVVYSIGKNFYFITSMVIGGRSNHKCVEVLAAAPSPLSGTEEA